MLKFIFNYKKKKNLMYVFYNTTDNNNESPNFRGKDLL